MSLNTGCSCVPIVIYTCCMYNRQNSHMYVWPDLWYQCCISMTGHPSFALFIALNITSCLCNAIYIYISWYLYKVYPVPIMYGSNFFIPVELHLGTPLCTCPESLTGHLRVVEQEQRSLQLHECNFPVGLAHGTASSWPSCWRQHIW